MQPNPSINTLIVGAGKAGELVAKNIIRDKASPFNVIGFVDDKKRKIGTKVAGRPVLGTSANIRQIVESKKIQDIIFAIPSQRGGAIRDMIFNNIGLRVTYRILPRRPEILMQGFDQDFLKYIRKLGAEDLLGGEILKSDQAGITKFAKGQTILITGAAGSIGSELSRQLAAHGTKKIIFYDWWENGMFSLHQQLMETNPKGDYEFIIGDIKDRKKLSLVFDKFSPTTVFHAAAYKHVPLMEHNAPEAIKNNIVGTRVVAELAVKYGVKKFILVSSDKAVNPTNIMGATKRSAEKVIHILAESQKNTILCAVRFGNVVNSNGSAIPTFERQIERGGPVTVTHKEITRYFMTIPEAVHLILQAWVMGQNNDLFVLDMGEPVKIYDLAELLIALEGYIPNKDIKVEIVGLRPGEKLFEEILVKEEETTSTAVRKVFRTKNYMKFDKLAFINKLNILIESAEDDGMNTEDLKVQLKSIIPTYKPGKN